MTTPEEIVRTIAEDKYPGDSNPEDWRCGYCGCSDNDLVIHPCSYDHRNVPEEHPMSCVWRQSIEWVQAQG